MKFERAEGVSSADTRLRYCRLKVIAIFRKRMGHTSNTMDKQV